MVEIVSEKAALRHAEVSASVVTQHGFSKKEAHHARFHYPGHSLSLADAIDSPGG
jgi:hypothetical protein